MSEPSAVKRPRRGARKTTRRNELTDELASGSEALDSRDAPSFSVQEDILVYRTEPGEAVLLKVESTERLIDRNSVECVEAYTTGTLLSVLEAVLLVGARL